MTDNLISKEQAIDKIKKRLFETALNNVGIKQNIDETLVDVAENRLETWFDELSSVQSEHKGRWIPDDSELGIKCNKCGKSFSEYINAGTGYVFLMEIPNFCSNCGADMRGDKHEID